MINERLSDVGYVGLGYGWVCKFVQQQTWQPQDSYFEVSAPPMSGTILHGYYDVIVVSLNSKFYLNFMVMIVLSLIKTDNYTEHWDFYSIFLSIFYILILLLKDIVTL